MNQRVGILDVETTFFKKGNPFSQRNKLCLYGLRIGNETYQWKIEYDNEPYGSKLKEIQSLVNTLSGVVGVNVKFDIHWSYRYGIAIPFEIPWIDLQIPFYIRSRQEHKYPSLNDMLDFYGLERKLNVVEEEYWNKGFDTTEVPLPLLLEYHAGDLEKTQQVYERETLTPLMEVACEDLKSTFEMERNGMQWDFDEANRCSIRIDETTQEVDKALSEFIDDFPVNWASPTQLAAVLYGGDIKYREKEDFEFVYANGKTKLKQRSVEKIKTFSGFVNPIEQRVPKTPGGAYSTEDGVIRMLTGKAKTKKFIGLLVKRRSLEKLKDTYYDGFTRRFSVMDWNIPFLHPVYHHCSTDTSRLSGSNPNPQNIPDEVRKCIVSRF